MARFDSADLLARCVRFAQRPTVDREMTPAAWYSHLSDAQDHWAGVFASLFTPGPMHSASTQMTTANGGKTYTIPGVTKIIGIPVVRDGEFGAMLDTRAYILDGATLRLPYNAGFSFTPWIRYVAVPPEISAASPPSLLPEYSRILLPYRACALWASSGGLRDPAFYENLERRAWHGEPEAGEPGIRDRVAYQTFPGDLELQESVGGGPVWYRSIDLS